MKKLSLMIAAFALAGVACGDSDKKSETDAGSDAGDITIPETDSGNGDPKPLFPECVREEIEGIPPYEGEIEFTEAELMACQTKCQMDDACYNEMNCPGVDGFSDCADATLINCEVAPKAKCREQWENYICCSDDAKCGEATTQEEFDACVDKSCSQYTMAISTCLMNPTTACRTKTNRECLAPPEDAGTPDTTDAGAPADKARHSSSSKLVKALARSMSFARVRQ